MADDNTQYEFSTEEEFSKRRARARANMFALASIGNRGLPQTTRADCA